MTSYLSQEPVSTYPIFSASKAYQDFLTQTIHNENIGNMDILTVNNMSVGSSERQGVSATDVYEGVLRDLGNEKISYGHWKHSLFRQYY